MRKFTFSVDFVVMEIDKDKDVLLILGIPFMKTTKVVIDVDNKKLRMGTQNDKAIFYVFGTLKECMKVEVNLVEKKKKKTISSGWKIIFGCFKPTQWKPEQLYDYNLPTLFSIENVDPNLKDEKPRSDQSVIFCDSKSKIFSKDGDLNIQKMHSQCSMTFSLILPSSEPSIIPLLSLSFF